MTRIWLFIAALSVFFFASCSKTNKSLESAETLNLVAVRYNNPGQVVDLGVGLWAWPLPMDFDCDGDMDLVVSCPDIPYNGTYFFENPEGNVAMPVFLPPVRIGEGKNNLVVSHVDGNPRVIHIYQEFLNFRDNDRTIFTFYVPININFHSGLAPKFFIISWVPASIDSIETAIPHCNVYVILAYKIHIY